MVDVITCLNNFLSSDLFNTIMVYLILPFFVSVIVVLVYDGLQYRKYFNALCQEITKNSLNIQNTAIDLQISRMREIHERCLKNPDHREWTGFGKTISLWIIIQETDTINRDFYRYLPNNQLKNFISRGYYSHIEDFATPLTTFYLACDRLSIFTQNLEKRILMNQERFFGARGHDTTDEQRIENFNQIISEIRNNLTGFQETITNCYSQLEPQFRKIRVFEIHRWLLTS